MSLQRGTPGYDPVLAEELASVRDDLRSLRALLDDTREQMGQITSRLDFLAVLVGEPIERVRHVYFTRYGNGIIRDVDERQVPALLVSGAPVWVSDQYATERRLITREEFGALHDG